MFSLGFLYRKLSVESFGICEYGMKDFLTTSFLRWKLMMSLGQDEPIFTYSHRYKRHIIKEACYGGTVGANIQEFNSSLCTEI